MTTIHNHLVRIVLDNRWPRLIRFEAVGGDQRLVGEREAVQPRLYLFRTTDRLTLTSDDAEIAVGYTLTADAERAVYHAQVTWDGQPAAEFDVVCELRGADLVLRLENARESGPYRFLTIRFPHLVSATSADPESLLVTCGWQGRLLDPKKCKPQLIDYSWCAFTARLCGAAYRSGFMVTLDIPGYEDLLIQDVWQYSRIGAAETLSGLGAELMYRQREIEGPREYRFLPPAEKLPAVESPAEPVCCGDHKEVRLHILTPAPGATLDWTDAARYFQSLVPASIQCEPRYDNALVYKIVLAQRQRPLLSVGDAEAIIRRIHHLTDGMKQVCYLAFFQYLGGESGFPEMFEVYPPVGDKAAIRTLIETAPDLNAVVSFHTNMNVYEHGSPSFDAEYTLRTFNGRMFCGWVLPDYELFSISVPAFKEQMKAIIARTIEEYGIRETYHMDTFSCAPYLYDAHPRHPFNATRFTQAHWDVIREWNRHGVDLTSEGLTDPYVGRIGHVWTLFNWDQIWEGEEKVPFANYVYHGSVSWNSGKAPDEKTILENLIQGGGSGVEFPEYSKDPIELIDSLYLLQVPYGLLRNRKWSAYRKTASGRRVEYGPESAIEVDDVAPGYRVVVDGELIAEDFATVFAGPRPGTYLAYSRRDRDLDWPAPEGLGDGPVPAVMLTEHGPGIRLEARVVNGRLHLPLKAHQPVRLGPV